MYHSLCFPLNLISTNTSLSKLMSKSMSFLSFHQSQSKSFTSKPASMSFSKEKQRSSSKNTGSKAFEPNSEEMKWVFDKFDANRDGKISKEEYKMAQRIVDKQITEKELEAAFKVMDSDGDGYVDFKEFMELYNNGGGVKVGEINSAFKVFDLDGDGKISAEELMVILKRLGERHSLKACKQMVKAVDKDGDGLIDINEFMSMMMSTNNNKLHF